VERHHTHALKDNIVLKKEIAALKQKPRRQAKKGTIQ
jgi:hypothetical protein